ncbi:TonB-dependent receptor plug domain-containing protein [Niabella aquatica]
MKATPCKLILVSATILGATLQLSAQNDTSAVLEAVTVTTGQYRSQSLKKSVYKVKVITAEQIKAKAALNMTQVLNTELGFRFSNDNTLGVSDVQLMGMSGRSIKILLDGVPVADRNDTRESLNQVDLQTVERIEIVEGPMSVMYGSDALAGVINIITKKANGTRFSVGARVQEETAGDEYSFLGNKGLHLQSVNAAYAQRSFFVNGGFTHNDFRGFGGEYGRGKTWKPKEQYLGNITLGHRGEKNTVYYRLDGLDETITSKGAINMDTYKAFDQRYITRRWMHQVQDDWQVSSKFHLNTSASYTDYSRRTRSTRHDFTTNADELTTGAGEQDTAVFTTLFFRTQAHYMFNEKISFQPGLEFNRNAASGARIEGSPVINDFAFFASAEWKPVSIINIRPGFRLIKNSLYDAPPIVPALNTKIRLSDDIDLRLSYAKGYRAPALRELYFDFIDANHTILGNKDLKAETSNSFNGSLSWSYNNNDIKAMSTLSGFYNVFNDLIDYALDPADNTTTKLFNVSKFKTTGVSFEQGFMYRQLQLNVGALFIGRYNDLTNEEGLSREVPRFNWSPEVNATVYYNISKIKTNLALLYKYSGARKTYQMVNGSTSDVELRGLNSFSWADFSISKTLFNTVTLQAGVKNIFDINSINNTAASGGAHSTGGPAPISYGRSYFLGIAYQFFK